MSQKNASQGASEPGVRVTKRPTTRRTKKATTPQVVSKSMTVSEIIALSPQTTEVMAEYGLHCFGCSANEIESLEEGCLGHGFSEEDIDLLVTDLNEIIASTPPRPQTLTITETASDELSRIAASEGKDGHGLAVIADEHGGFCLEFQEKPQRGDKVFSAKPKKGIEVYASILTLQRIGGSTIDFRDGRFKLDVETGESSCACGKGECGCK